MQIDREALLGTFLAETDEGLSAMEEALTALEREPEGKERLDEIFRLAHTLKGNALTFGFSEVAELAHVVEELLDRLRDGSRRVTDNLITLLLGAVDVLGEMVTRSAAGERVMLAKEKALLKNLAAVASGELEGSLDPLITTDEIELCDGFGSTERERSSPSTTSEMEASLPTIEVRRSGLSPASERSRSLRVDLDKLDRLLNLTGEVCIARGQITQMLENPLLRREALLESHREADLLYMDLQELVMKLRMVPVGPTFRHLIRVLRDLTRRQGKNARLEIEGEDVELDTSVIELLRDPLTHMVRNALDHGIETPEERTAANKDPCGLIQLRAYHDAGSIVIELADDGAGLDRERMRKRAQSASLEANAEHLTDQEVDQLIFEPGFSTAATVTDVSGRGVGMDVVRRNIETLRGTVSVSSRRGEGTTLSIRLPLTLAIIESFHVGLGEEIYIIPIESVVETLAFEEAGAFSETGRGVLSLRGRTLPCVRLRELLHPGGSPPSRENIVVIRHEGSEVGIVVDALLGQSQTVIKPLPKLLQGLPGVAGSAILGNGEVAFILDVPALLRKEIELEAVMER